MKVLKSFLCYLLFFAVFTIAFISCSDSHPIKKTKALAPVDPDSIFLFDERYETPFSFGEVSVQSVKEFVPDVKEVKSPYINRFDNVSVDTLITLKSKKSKFVFYTGKDYELFYFASIADPHITLKENIRIGMSREEFVNNFESLKNIEGLPQVIRMGYKEQLEVLNFIFKNDSLSFIIYDGAVD